MVTGYFREPTHSRLADLSNGYLEPLSSINVNRTQKVQLPAPESFDLEAVLIYYLQRVSKFDHPVHGEENL